MTRLPREPDRNAVVTRARELRRRPSPPEMLLWRELRKRPGGLKFRQQHPVGWYIVDFYCAAARLVIEIDGISHSMGERPERDARRDRWLRAQGLRVLRFAAADVMRDLDSAITAILIECRR
ncbi:MAG: endonuclease domain-containing protein [Sphingomicrobium sp.]